MTVKKKEPRSGAAPSASLDVPPTIEVPAGVFKNTCLALMDQVRDEGVHVLITKHGNAVARLVPAGSGTPGAMGFMRGTIVAEGDIVSPDFDAWGDS